MYSLLLLMSRDDEVLSNVPYVNNDSGYLLLLMSLMSTTTAALRITTTPSCLAQAVSRDTQRMIMSQRPKARTTSPQPTHRERDKARRQQARRQIGIVVKQIRFGYGAKTNGLSSSSSHTDCSTEDTLSSRPCDDKVDNNDDDWPTTKASDDDKVLSVRHFVSSAHDGDETRLATTLDD